MLVSGIRAALAALAVCVITPAAAQYPSKQITIVVPLAAGSGVDLMTRFYAQRLNLGRPVVIENKPGAATQIGTAYVAASPPDGHTLLSATSSAMAINPFLYKKLSYDPNRDFVPINFYLKSPFVLCVNPNVPAKTVAELVKLAKEQPQAFSFGSPGAGTTQHLSMEYLKHKFAVNMTHVPYRSNPQYINDLVAGHLNVAFVESASASLLIREGKLRGLASATAERLSVLPDLPTLAEAVNDPDIETVSWHMLFAPAATPKDIVDRLHTETRKATTSPEFVKQLLDRGQVPVASPPPDGIRAYIKSEQEKWGALVRRLGLEGSQ